MSIKLRELVSGFYLLGFAFDTDEIPNAVTDV